jgi:hypothetical protein
MIHVGVGYESMRNALARGQWRHVAKIEQQCPTAETEIDEQPGIREGIIDEPRLHEPRHLSPSRSVGTGMLQSERGIVRDKCLRVRNFGRVI